MKEYIIGVLGGMGTYATIHLFEQYARVFEAEKEWDRPRMLIDNRCTMPSRVRAYLYDEKVDELVGDMTESLSNLINVGCTRLVLACNTSHLFLPKVYENLPEAEDKIVHIIKTTVDQIVEDGIKEVYLLGTEGTIDSGIYQRALEEKGVKCLAPEESEYKDLRECIEAVKQEKYSEEVRQLFAKLINRHEYCILGCTELPVLYEKYIEDVNCKKVYDPLMMVMQILKAEYEEYSDK